MTPRPAVRIAPRRIGALLAGIALAAAATACSGGDGADPTPAAPTPTVDVFRATPVAQTIRLSDGKIEGMPERVSGGGVIEFTAVNEGTVPHKLSVFQVFDGGRMQLNGQTGVIAPGQSGGIAILTDPGTYELACTIQPGEAGSTEDHRANGEVTRFVVE